MSAMATGTGNQHWIGGAAKARHLSLHGLSPWAESERTEGLLKSLDPSLFICLLYSAPALGLKLSELGPRLLMCSSGSLFKLRAFSVIVVKYTIYGVIVTCLFCFSISAT